MTSVLLMTGNSDDLKIRVLDGSLKVTLVNSSGVISYYRQTD